MLLNCTNDLKIVADRAVRHKADDADVILPVRSIELRRLQDESEEATLVRAMCKQSIFNTLACHVILQDEISVRNLILILQTHDCARACRSFNINLVVDGF